MKPTYVEAKSTSHKELEPKLEPNLEVHNPNRMTFTIIILISVQQKQTDSRLLPVYGLQYAEETVITRNF